MRVCSTWEGFASFNPYMFSGDYSIVGTVHSPSGNNSPSDVDLNYFWKNTDDCGLSI